MERKWKLRYFLGAIWGIYRDNGKQNGSFYLGCRVLYWDNGKENGSYYRVICGVINRGIPLTESHS